MYHLQQQQQHIQPYFSVFCRNIHVLFTSSFLERGRPSSLCNITGIKLCEMVSVLVCILPSLVSVESTSWRQFLPLPRSLLVRYLTHPLARLALEILFIALSGFSSSGPIRSISAPFEERITNISPLQPQTPPCSVTSMNPFDVPR